MFATNASVIGAISTRRRVLVPAVADEERRDPAAVLQLRLVDVEVHPVDRLDLENHVL